MALIIGLLIFWLLQGNPLQIHLTAATIFPSFSHTDNWMALTAIMLGFAGMELASVHIKDVDHPQRNFPRALAFSSLIILSTMMLGSLAIAFILPYDQINLVNGTIQTFAYFLSAYHISWLLPVLTLLLILGTLGGIISWVISPIKGLGQAAQQGFLPPFFEKHNAHGVPQNLLITQAVIVSLVCTAFLLMPSINASFWLLTALTTQLYILMYVILFLSGLRLRHKMTYPSNTFRIPGKKWGAKITCWLGLFGCLVTFIVGFIPPNNIDIGSKFFYELLFCGGILIMLLPVLFFYWYQGRRPALVPQVSTDLI